MKDKCILKLLVKSLNCIFVSLYLMIMFFVLREFNFVIFSKIILYIILFILFLIFIHGILLFRKYKKEIKSENEVSEYYYDFFKNNYIRGNKFWITYLIFFILILLLLSFANEYIVMLLEIAIVDLVIRKAILIKEFNKLNFKVVNGKLKEKSKKDKVKSFLIYIFVYILITSIITVAFCVFTNAWYSWFIIGVLALIILIIKFIINSPSNKYYEIKKSMFSIKVYNLLAILFVLVLIYITMIVGVYFLKWYIEDTKSVDVNEHKIVFEDNMYKIYKDENDFKILQLSDLHIGGSFITYKKDLKALESIKNLVTYTNPDLIIVTGDLIYPTPIQSFYLNNQTALFQLIAFFNNLNVPWTFVYGNHETEDYALRNADELYAKVISANDNMAQKYNKLLYYNYDNNISGRSNMIFEIINSDNTINQVLYLIDSGDYYSNVLNDYDYIRDDQVEWYKETLEEIGVNNSSMIFFHMPLVETKEAIDKYLNNDEDVKYYFGEFNEKVACSRFRSKIFDTALELGSTKAMFYGHDHSNNISLEYKGIRLTYGMSIDYLATIGIENKTKQRGATLITLHNDSYDIEQIREEDIK